METKHLICSVCGQSKSADADNFPLDGGRLRRQCKPCRAEQKRLTRQASETPERRERRLAKAREYNRLHSERILKRAAQRYLDNRDRYAEYSRAAYARNKDQYKARARAWRVENRDRKLENNRKWAAENADKAAASALASKSRRRQSGQVRLSEAVSSQVRLSLLGNKQGLKWERLVGYNLGRLRAHLERQFLPGMSWENYGEWHVDHILPVASFSFSSPDDADFKACWSLTNLRPLWAADNISKRDKRLLLL